MKATLNVVTEPSFVSAEELPVGRISADHSFLLLKVNQETVLVADKATGTVSKDTRPSQWAAKRTLQPIGTQFIITT